MLTVGDVVALDSQAAFVNDVQLSAYDDKGKNIRLLRSYLFSSAKGQTTLSATNEITPVELLRRLTDIYLSERAPNRLVVVANYGHGKSHLALALANYFGRPAGSDEVKIVLEKLNGAVADAASRQRYQDFKNNKGSFLLVRLRGDEPNTLQAQFIAGLERGLAEHEATRDESLPFWYQTAERYLTALTPDQVRLANQYLQPREKDLALLLDDVRRRQDVFGEVVATIEAATGVKPALNDVGLAQAVEWASSKFVGQDKPFGGILVLFDEFTLFITRYASQHAAAELQDLLNGIQKTQGKTAFLALAQMDPDATADHLTLSGSHRAELKKVLSRIETRLVLSTVMESVIDAYLVQSPGAWEELNKQRPVHGALVGASDTTLTTFSRRYERTLRWTPTQFGKVVTEGCFPLHPITTALLCNMSLGTVSDSGSTRTVLGFVMTQLDAKKTEPAVTAATRPNWVLPVALIDYFGVRFSGDVYRSYTNAVQTVGAEETAEQIALLKALLLQELSQLSLRSDDQFDFLCAATGLERPVTGENLRQLVQANAIRQDPSKKTYSLWPATSDPRILETLIRKKLDALSYDVQAEINLNTKLSDIMGSSFGDQAMDVKWGHARDWAVHEVIASSETPLEDRLRSSQPQFRFEPKNGSIVERPRGFVYWLVARNDAERVELRQAGEALMDRVFSGDSPPPVVLVLPDAPRPDLVANFQRLRAVVSFTTAERAEAGPDIVQAEINRLNEELKKALIELRGSPTLPFDVPRSPQKLVVPLAYRAAVKERDKISLKAVFQECYAKAYRWRPPEFSTSYQVTGKGPGKLRSATARVASALLKNVSRSLADMTASDSFTRDLYEKYLVKAWGLLSPDLRIQKPTAAGVRAAWDYLDDRFEDDEQSRRLDEVLIDLLNPPFGFDYNTAVLIFAGWFGFNSLDLRIRKSGAIEKVDVFTQWLEAGARDFFKQVSAYGVTLSRGTRIDDGMIAEAVRAYREKQYSQDEASEQIAVFQSWVQDPRIATELREAVQAAAEDLRQEAQCASDYDRLVNEINRDVYATNSLQKLIDAEKRIGKLPKPGLVQPNMPSPSEVLKALWESIEAAVEKANRQYEKLDDLAAYQSNRDHLMDIRKALSAAGMAAQVKLVDQALGRLEERGEALRKEAKEATIQAAIKRMRTDLPLVALYEQRDELQQYTNLMPETKRLCEQKLAYTVEEINRLETAAQGLNDKVLGHTDVRRLREYRDSLVRMSSRYSGSDYAVAVEQARKRAEQLEEFLGEVATTHTHRLRGEGDVTALRDRLGQLEASNQSWLGDAQRAMLAKARQELDKQVVGLRERAIQWLAGVEGESRANGKNPVELMQALSAPLPFLPPEHQPRLEQLRQETQQRIDRNVVHQIDQLFRQIKDPNVQRECVTHLNLLIRK